MSKRISTEDFIAAARSVHGDTYDYSQVHYEKATQKVRINCPKHGEFLQTPASHNQGTGCPRCCGRGKTLEQIITEFKATHGDRYDYSKFKLITLKTKATIICKNHGEFLQSASSHISGRGCPQCAQEKRKQTLRVGKEKAIERANILHKYKYDYSKTEIINLDEPVIITCPIHGDFSQNFNGHLHGHGCPQCGIVKRSQSRKMSTDEWIDKAVAVHGDTYDYSKAEYKGAHDLIKIICPQHGAFTQTSTNHLSGNGCPKCASNYSGTPEEKIKQFEKLFEGKYNYREFEYHGAFEKSTVICPTHGRFEVSPTNHLRGKGCPKCIGRNLSDEELIAEFRAVHGDTYDYSKFTYNGYASKSTVICEKHGEFYIQPASHKQGVGCPVCKESKGEREIARILDLEHVRFEREKQFSWIKANYGKKYRYDFYLPDYEAVVEFHGTQHYEFVPYFHKTKQTFIRNQKRDEHKRKIIEEAGFYFLAISYQDYGQIKEILQKFLKDCGKILNSA